MDGLRFDSTADGLRNTFGFVGSVYVVCVVEVEIDQSQVHLRRITVFLCEDEECLVMECMLRHFESMSIFDRNVLGVSSPACRCEYHGII